MCKDAGVERLSLFALSTENWERKPREVLMVDKALVGDVERQ